MKLNHPDPATETECASSLGMSPADFSRLPVERRLAVAEAVSRTKNSTGGRHIGAAEIAAVDARLSDDDWSDLPPLRRMQAATEREAFLASEASRLVDKAVVEIPIGDQIAMLRKQLDVATDEQRWSDAAGISLAISRLEIAGDVAEQIG